MKQKKIVQQPVWCYLTWMIKVVLALQRLGFLLWSENPVEAVLAEDHHLPLVVVDFVLSQQLHDLLTHRRLQA